MKKIGIILVLCLLLLPFPSIASASENLDAKPLTVDNIEEFADQYFENIEEMHIPGAVIIVFKDGEIWFEKGYGYSNLETGALVDPKGSLFRIGSISKLFTATAIMQLVEDGLVDLEQDVNHYFTDFQIESAGFAPIQVKHLLTHTSGFDERVFGMAIENYEDMIDLKEYLKANEPKRVRAPGQYIQYSNYGMGLLGLVIEEVTGLSYETYIKEHILLPLEMTNTHVVMNSETLEDLVREYSYSNGEYIELPLYDFGYPPAGSFLSTAEDMTKFMQIHLNQGEWNGVRILEEETIGMMHERQFSQHPLVQGFGFGFFENMYNQHRILEHGGNTAASNSMFMLDQEENLGIFISNNSSSGALLTYYFGNAFLDHFYPANQSVAQLVQTETVKEESLDRYAGNYKTNRYSHYEISKLVVALSPSIKVRNQGNEFLSVQYIDQELEYKQVSPLAFFNEETQQYIAFEEDQRGNITHLFFSDKFVYEKNKWYENVLLHGLIVILITLFAVSTCVRALALVIRRMKKNQEDTFQQGKYKWSRLSELNGTIISLSFILFLVFLMIKVPQMMKNEDFMYELPLMIKLSAQFPILFMIMTLLQGFFLVKVWKDDLGSRFRRVYSTLFFVLSLSMILIFYYYNWIGYTY